MVRGGGPPHPCVLDVEEGGYIGLYPPPASVVDCAIVVIVYAVYAFFSGGGKEQIGPSPTHTPNPTHTPILCCRPLGG